ncbi:HD domain-containing protein [Baekduia soli]|uniref:HD domain-containing protein n=2 Tax=Baekduia soli TaxID=496014 RepID=A0A5B8UC84_9ACTN|nr:HD domain-containing protein [Baekduia soli]
MAGAEIQANAIWTALHGLPLRDVAAVINLLLVAMLSFAVPLLRIRLRVLPAALMGPLLALGLLAGAQIAFDHGAIVWLSAPLLAVALGTVTMIIASHLSETATRRRVAQDNDVLEAKVRERTQQLRRTQLEILQRLSRAAEWRDEDTGLHITRMGKLSELLAEALGLPAHETETLGHAAVAHDMGKIAIPDRILLKPGPLTPDERIEMQRHAAIGASMLGDSESDVMQLAETIARTHHERWDGSGYPDGLRGPEIPLAGRICGLCDVFDALVSERTYKQPWPLDRALDEIAAQRGRHFDPELVDAFLEIAAPAYRRLYGAGVTKPRVDRAA